jgi:hypothetical protein
MFEHLCRIISSLLGGNDAGDGGDAQGGSNPMQAGGS